MALSGEIASMFVRLRPSFAGFGAEATAGVKSALAETQAQVDAVARANVAAGAQEVDANLAIAKSYGAVAAAAEHGSTQQLVAIRLAKEATKSAEASIGASAVAAKAHASGLSGAFFGLGGSASKAEKEIGRAGRGALAGSGVFSGLGRSLAFASGGFLAFASASSVIRDSLSGAALLQKSGEAIRAQFGAAGEAIRSFADRGAAQLGISGGLAEKTAARFGILFKNLGIGQREASGMTVGFEKLAGAINAIKGGGSAGAAQVLQSIVLAAAGNTRGLKQLGISIDSTQIKYAALKLGLISTVKDAITPAIKAQAIYALATANLPAYLDQARKHSGDFANVQARLAAEFSNAKDKLGSALLPTFTKYATELANWLGRMNQSGKLQRDFNAIVATTGRVVKTVADAVGTGWHIFQTAAGWIGGTKNAAAALLAVLAVSKFAGIARGVGNLVNTIAGIGRAARAAAIVFGIAAASEDAATIATAATIRTALITTGIGALIVAIGFAAGYIITHWDKVKRYTVAVAAAIAATWQGLKTTLIGIAEVIGGSMTTYLTAPLRGLLKAAGFLGGLFDSVFGTHLSSGLKKANNLLDSISTNLAGNGVRNIRRGFTQMASGATDAFNNSLAKHTATGTPFMHGINAAGESAGHNLGKTMTDATTTTVTTGLKKTSQAVADGVANAVAAAQQKIQDSVKAAKSNLDSIGQKLADSIAKIMDKLGGVGAGIAGSPQAAAFKKLRELLFGGGSSEDIRRAAQSLSTQIQAAPAVADRKAAIKQRLADLTDEFSKGAISLKTFNRKLSAELARDHVSYKSAGKVLGVAFADGFRAQVAGLRAQADAIAAVPARYRGAGGGGGDATIKIVRPLEVIRSENQKIAHDAARQREKQIKAADRTAKAAEKTANAVATLKSTKVGMLPGDTAHKGRTAARTGVKP